MKLRTLDNFNFKGKRVLLRSDLNSEVKNGRVVLGDRILEAKKTISELKRKGARVIILSHQSRPGEKDFISLKGHARLLKVKFVDDIIGKKAVGEILKLKNGEALLLENVRTLKEEFKPSRENAMVKVLGNLCDIFINDAFSVCHRKHTSVVGFAKVLPPGVGRLMERELKALEKLKMRNCLYIVGGKKIEDKSLLIKKKNKILLTGLLAVKYKNKKIKKNVVLPVDYASDFKDIGSETIKLYKKEITKAKCVLVAGPPGKYEAKRFERGTREIFKAVASSTAFSVIAGGDTANALRKIGISKKKFGYVSLSGGAFLAYLVGQRLPGIEALKKN